VLLVLDLQALVFTAQLSQARHVLGQHVAGAVDVDVVTMFFGVVHVPLLDSLYQFAMFHSLRHHVVNRCHMACDMATELRTPCDACKL